MSTADRAEALLERINEAAKEFADKGMKSDAYGLAGSAILCGQLVKALERIERLESDISLLTDLLAGLEKTQ